MNKLIISFLFLFSTSAFSQWYFGPGIGYSRYINPTLKSKDAVSSGSRLGGIVGYKYLLLAFESFYNRAKTKTDPLNFEDQKYVYHADIASYGALMKYFMGLAHVRFGYSFHKFKTSISQSPSGAAVDDQRVKTEFGVSDINYHGPLFGIGLDFPLGPIAPYGVITSYQLNNTEADIMEIEIGLKISL